MKVAPLTLVTFVCVLSLVLSGCSRDPGPLNSTEVAIKGIQAAALSSDGKHLSIGSVHHGGSLWRTADGERLFNWNHQNDGYSTIIASDFSADGRWALTAETHTLVLWDMQTGEASRFWTAPGDVLSVSLSNNGNYALLGLNNFSAVLFDIKRGGIKRTLQHSNRVRSVDLSDDGNFALTGSEDYTSVFWDLRTGQALQTITHNDDVQIVALSGDGRLAMSAGKYDKALLWETQTGKVIGDVPLAAENLSRGMRFTAARFSNDGRQLLTGRPDQIVQLWDTRSLTQLARWRLPKRDAWKPTSASVIAVGFTGNSNRFRAAASNGFVHTIARP